MNVRAEPSRVLEVPELPGELVTIVLLGTGNTHAWFRFHR